MRKQEIFYHYCSVDVLLSILKNDELRLSDIEKSNDYTERKWMMSKIKEEFINIASKNNVIEEKEKLIKVFCRLGNDFEILANIYATCFSKDGDLLSQWRAYAQDGSGVAIGFSAELLKKVNDFKYGIKFLPIIYNSEKQKEYKEIQAKKILDLFLQGDDLFHAMSEVFTNDLENLCCYKNPAFYEEKEWRLCISLSPECRRSIKAPFDSFVMSEIKLYSNQKRIVTYLDLNYTKVKNEIIKEIILGPKCEISEKDMHQILFILGYETADIEIKKSKATYL
ncbi:DUF2971 domain-containing protein [Clostridium algidicarnis]|uniref:DUF2971 domain-containing protein n=1 Tax=Clostridium algidicarnis TaxID=37659 RepID=A0ABS6C6C1_9CLOT|nr:DUF2971 domain-containing protein [Clostridium algidicarnis]MBU3221028.1 DUF2971 domain-containing protein [Clostridium algidicarnis]